VPPSASSNRPFRSAVAPVKAPRSCPKSSLSSRVSASAPQCTPTKGPSRRGLHWWISLATSSFPVPLGPVTRTVAGVGATSSTSRLTGAIALPRKISSAGGYCLPNSSARRESLRSWSASLSTRRITWRSSSGLPKGFVR